MNFVEDSKKSTVIAVGPLESGVWVRASFAMCQRRVMVSVRFCFGITVVDGGGVGGRERISIQHFREYVTERL